MESAYQLTRDVYDKRNLPIGTKLSRNNAVIKPESLYTKECMFSVTVGKMEQIEKKANNNDEENTGIITGKSLNWENRTSKLYIIITINILKPS